ncbi:tripartite tricarboxylate transporter substrate binding protein [Geomicrobium sp. JCM 19055]|uniref:tripartite tricarboxylate transporter substrate binding protein n=1 Tax=Geomicrobium sp. JCM 19055 TaxID=1460649 RepID=UPI00045EDCBE|nr:tripartite tricarboxylate transporter substrate binding protein [Geomicrobium sp. JCM 19055]GAK00081.1 hypothetical protein JCM19055_3150 [Geomicrobium sp. JCM 19055]
MIIILLLFVSGSYLSSEVLRTEKADIREQYPERTMEILVGYGAGGGTDLSARNMVQALTQEGVIDQSFFVENKVGAGGALAIRQLAESDEHTLAAVPEFGDVLWNGTAGVELSELTPIAQVAQDYHLIAVHKDSPYETIEQLLDALKENPESHVVSVGGTIVGMEAWGWQEIFDDYGIDGQVRMLPLEGSNAALTNVLAGDAHATFVVPQLAQPHIDEGNIRPLAVLTDERTEQFPELPTLREKGLDVTYYRPRGFWINGDAPDYYVEFWEEALEEMVETETWQTYVEQSGLLPEFQNQEEYREQIIADGESYQQFYEKIQEEIS